MDAFAFFRGQSLDELPTARLPLAGRLPLVAPSPDEASLHMAPRRQKGSARAAARFLQPILNQPDLILAADVLVQDRGRPTIFRFGFELCSRHSHDFDE